jgi:hypothetical protein
MGPQGPLEATEYFSMNGGRFLLHNENNLR